MGLLYHQICIVEQVEAEGNGGALWDAYTDVVFPGYEVRHSYFSDAMGDEAGNPVQDCTTNSSLAKIVE